MNCQNSSDNEIRDMLTSERRHEAAEDAQLRLDHSHEQVGYVVGWQDAINFVCGWVAESSDISIDLATLVKDMNYEATRALLRRRKQ